MGRAVSLDIRLRPLDTKRFVGDFVRKFGAWIPKGASVRTACDLLRCAPADLDWLDRDFKYSRKTRCWTAHGDQVINARQEDDLREFIAWCVPYVDPATARFEQQTGLGWGTYCRVKYKIVDGRLKEFSRAITLHANDYVFEPPKASEIIDFLKLQCPTATERDGEFVVDFGINGFGWDEVGDDGDIRRELAAYKSNPDRQFGDFSMSFDVFEDGEVGYPGFYGPCFNWNKYVVYDKGLTPDDLAAAIGKHVTICAKTKRNGPNGCGE